MPTIAELYLQKFKNLISGELFKSLSVYTLMGFVNKAFPILLLPFLTRVLTPTDYGIMAMFATVKAFFGPFMGLGAPNAIERYYFDKKEINFQEFVTNIFVIIMGTAIFFGSIFLIFSNTISTYSGIPKSYLWIVIVISLGTIVNKINLIIYRVQFKSKSFAWLNFFETAMYFLLMVILVLGLKFDWRADFFSQLIVYTLLGIWGVIILKKADLLTFKVKINKDYIKSAMAFGLPMFVHTFGLFFVNMTDRLFITNFIGLEATGIYTIGFKMATIVVFFITAYNNAYIPWLYEKLKKNTNDSIKKAYSSTLYSALFVTFMGLILIAFLPLLYPVLIGEQFASSMQISRIILFGEIFNAFYILLMGYILFQKATQYIMYITLSTSLVSVGLNFWLIPLYGIEGAAYILLLVYFIKFLLTFFAVWLLYKNIKPTENVKN
jgi:O-antigen/teichoic acid export membrane protein